MGVHACILRARCVFCVLGLSPDNLSLQNHSQLFHKRDKFVFRACYDCLKTFSLFCGSMCVLGVHACMLRARCVFCVLGLPPDNLSLQTHSQVFHKRDNVCFSCLVPVRISPFTNAKKTQGWQISCVFHSESSKENSQKSIPYSFLSFSPLIVFFVAGIYFVWYG